MTDDERLTVHADYQQTIAELTSKLDRALAVTDGQSQLLDKYSAELAHVTDDLQRAFDVIAGLIFLGAEREANRRTP